MKAAVMVADASVANSYGIYWNVSVMGGESGVFSNAETLNVK